MQTYLLVDDKKKIIDESRTYKTGYTEAIILNRELVHDNYFTNALKFPPCVKITTVDGKEVIQIDCQIYHDFLKIRMGDKLRDIRFELLKAYDIVTLNHVAGIEILSDVNFNFIKNWRKTLLDLPKIFDVSVPFLDNLPPLPSQIKAKINLHHIRGIQLRDYLKTYLGV